MTLRALITGLAIALFVSAFTYYNDQVIRQTFFVGSHLPTGVIGMFLVLVLLGNTALKRFGSRFAFSSGELLVIAALGLSSCGWAGSSLMRGFTQIVALPGHVYSTKPDWQSVEIMSYVPDGSPLLGEGHITDWPRLIAALNGRDPESAAAVAGFTSGFTGEEKADIGRLDTKQHLTQADRQRVLGCINRLLQRDDLFHDDCITAGAMNRTVAGLLKKRTASGLTDHEIRLLNRHILVSFLPSLVLPPVQGTGVLIDHGRGDATAVTALTQGWEGAEKPGLPQLPWSSWQGPMLFWGPLILLFGLASFFLVIIVQPQWKKELLPYPIARFIQEFAEPGDRGFLPRVTQSKLFWPAFVIMIVIHLVNGLQAWFPRSIQIPLTYQFFTFFEIFPTEFLEASFFYTVMPTLYPTVVAFTYFLGTQVSFSIGVSGLLYAVLVAVLGSYGVSLTAENGDSCFAVSRFGSYPGTGVMVLYLGRRYYRDVFLDAFGRGKNHASVPSAVRWALRGTILCVAAMTFLLSVNGLDWPAGAMLVLIILLNSLVLTRINAETGLFFNQPLWIAATPVIMLFGTASLGPTVCFMLFIVSMVLANDVREILMPFVANSLHVAADKGRPLPPRGTMSAVAAVIVLSLVVSFCATLFFQYRHGINFADVRPFDWSEAPFTRTSAVISQLSAYGQLAPSMTVSGIRRFLSIKPDPVMSAWALAGALLVIGCGLMRATFHWWPLHPVIFLVWGTFFPSNALGASILAGWLVKSTVVRYSGARGYTAVKPFMYGIIAGELVAAPGWMITGAVYYLATGLIPRSYSVFFS